MDLYDIGILAFCIIMVCLILISISKNILTEYGVGLLIAILVLGIIGHNIWIDFHIWELLKEINLPFLKNK
jgi:hypothetical protein